MSAEKGGALVRSPPGLVEAYNAHVTGSAKWGEPSAPHIPPHKQPQPQRNATVTKHPSGGYHGSSTTHSTTSAESKWKKTGINEENSEGDCGCNSWARVRQLEHDLDQLQRTHEVILSGLHSQLEEMKQKNRDLTFQLLMGPYANAVQVAVPLSPESDVTSPKDTAKNEGRPVLEVSPDPGERKKPAGEQNHLPTREQPNVTTIHERSNNIKSQKKLPKGKSSDPRQARSLDLEILEEETEELTKQLEEERAKNKYLLTLVEDLKRQIREETGSWYPPPPNAKRVGQTGSYRQNFDGRRPYAVDGTNPNLFKLPQLSYEQRPQLMDQEQQQQMPEMASQSLQRKKESSKLFERSRDLGTATTLPALIHTGNRQRRRLEQSKMEEEKGGYSPSRELSYARGKQHHNKGKSKYRHHLSGHPSHSQRSSERQNLPEQESLSQNQQQSPKERHPQKHSQLLNFSKESQEGHELHPYSQKKSELPKSTSSVQQRLQGQQMSSLIERRQSPRQQRTEAAGKSTLRARTVSRGRGAEIARSSRESSTSGKVAVSPSRQNHVSNVPPNGSGSPASHSKSDGGANIAKNKGANFRVDSSTGSLDVSQLDKLPEAAVASSSNSGISLTSSGSRVKHRGRANKRGGKKNRKDTHNLREEPRDK